MSKILVVDDNAANLGVITNHLESEKFTVLVARNGAGALAKAAYARPDLILLDVVMPGGLNGFQTCQRLKADETTAAIPVIFMTSLVETPFKVAGFEAGGVDYITKPVQVEEMLARVRTHLRLRELTERLEQLVLQRTAELDAAYRRLAKLDQAKSDFIQVVSHELRTPLAIVDGYAQLLQLDSAIQASEDSAAMVDGIYQSNQQMLTLVNHVLDATQVDQGSLPMMPATMRLSSVLAVIHEALAPVLAQRQLTLTYSHLAELPALVADEVLMHKLFQQLISNSMKHTPDGGCITVTGRLLPADQLEVVVADTGVGIPFENLELIFEKFFHTSAVDFYSTSATKFKGGGPGLGLVIARGIVEAHGGQIWAESDGYDETTLPGARIHVRLPLSLN